jgi:hypothetical protein
MKQSALLTILALGAAYMTTAPVQAQTVDPCTVYMCMAGISGFGATGGPACAPALVLLAHRPSRLQSLFQSACQCRTAQDISGAGLSWCQYLHQHRGTERHHGPVGLGTVKVGQLWT